MSSSNQVDRAQATPWALDEFASFDIYPSADASQSNESTGFGSHDDARADVTHAHLEEQAYLRGLHDGEQHSRERLHNEIHAQMATLSAVIESIRMHESLWLANVDENIAALAVSVARHIVQREIVTDATTVQQLAHRALAQFPLEQTITVRLNPEDHALLSGTVETSVRSDGRTQDISWTADPRISRGGCLVEGRERIIDGRVDTALERLYRAIGQVQA